MDHAFGRRKAFKSVHSVLEDTQQDKITKEPPKGGFLKQKPRMHCGV